MKARQSFEDCTPVVSSIMEKLNGLPPSPTGACCMDRVHNKFRRNNEYAYTPEVVSIGPFHRDREGLLDMEPDKLRYMNELLSRTGNKEEKLHQCVQLISTQEAQVRRCYSKYFVPERDKFIEMMITDALFVIELLGKCVGEENISSHDPIFSKIWTMASLVRDLILLENQIPMLVLKKLFKITMGNYSCVSLNELAIRFFNPLMPTKENVLVKYFHSGHHLDIEANHLLDLVSKTFHDLHQDPNDGDRIEHPRFEKVPCVTELRRSGIKIRRGSDSSNFLDIRFKEGVLEIPRILIQDQTDTLLRNLIALEQCSDGRDMCMTSYALLMNSLVRSVKDVELLCKIGIITNYLDKDECVYSLFSKLSGELTVTNFHYSDVCYQLNEFYTRRRNVCLVL